MLYLKLELGKTYIMRIAENKLTPRTYHWWKGKSVDCEGEGCQYCRSMMEIRHEGWLDVLVEGIEYRWSFPASVGVKIKDVVPALLGETISVLHTKSGGRDLWDIKTYHEASFVKSVTKPDLEAIPLLRLMADTLESMAKEVRGIAQKLDGQR